jgi:uncharacterized membrane protein
MVLGILSLPGVFCYGFGLIASILAIIFGFVARGQIRREGGQGKPMATAGIVMGIIPFALLALIFIIAIVVGIVQAINK